MGPPGEYRAHLRRGDTPCAACRAANTADSRRLKDELEERMWQRHERMSPWGVFKHATILSALPPEEYEEARRLERRKRLSPAADQRLTELNHRAAVLHEAKQKWRAENPPDTSWYEELKDRMWAKLTPEEEAYWRPIVARQERLIDC